MPKDHTNLTDAIDYQALMDTAGLSVVRQALQIVAFHGIPGKHHFYISFLTDYPGLLISKYLVHKFPEEMTIVLQHQFSLLKVHLDKFEISLSFGGAMEKLVIPFKSITSFTDPSVNFHLNFERHHKAMSLPFLKEEGCFDFQATKHKNQYNNDSSSIITDMLGWGAAFHNTIKSELYETNPNKKSDAKEATKIETITGLQHDEHDVIIEINSDHEHDLSNYDDIKIIPISSYFTESNKDKKV